MAPVVLQGGVQVLIIQVHKLQAVVLVEEAVQQVLTIGQTQLLKHVVMQTEIRIRTGFVIMKTVLILTLKLSVVLLDQQHVQLQK